jgi:acyl-CoA thioesterase-1
MNPWLMLFADGTMFFIAMALTAAAFGLRLRFRARAAQMALGLAVWVGVVLVAFSAAPLPWLAYAVWLTAVLAGEAALHLAARDEPLSARGRAMIIAPMFACIVLIVMECPFHIRPAIRSVEGQTVYVIGDSISAPSTTGGPCWPDMLAAKGTMRVMSAAVPGARTASAIAQANDMPGDPALVIVEIGGNDLLGGTAADAFGRDLDRLLQTLTAKGHRVVMFELPLPPTYNSFGRWQRQLALQYNVTLIPKRVLGGVFAAPGATSDGLHLTDDGHQRLASAVAGMMRIEPK